MLDLRTSALCVALPVAVVGAFALGSERVDQWLAHGPIQAGHADVRCDGCHLPGRGTTRQQIQAKLWHAVGLREDDVDFGRIEVTSDACLDCHARPNERHPIYRFREPRFIDALQVVEADNCLGCHSEHHDTRVDVGQEICRACHDDLKVKNDPLDVAHVELIAREDWASCMGCHDFHGNHGFKPPASLASRIPTPVIDAYFANGASPYGTEKLFEAKDK